jgi:hypothetical protein
MGSRNRFENRNDSFSFAPPAGGSLSTEGRRAARRSAGTRRAILPVPASTPSGGSVTRMGGQEYNMSDPKQDTAYRTAQKAELDRQRGRSPMADIRGGGGLSDTGSRVARSTPAPRDPNNTGAKGTSMGSSSVIGRWKKQYGLKVRNPFESENLPGNASYGASFALNSGENQPSFAESVAAGDAAGLNFTSPALINAVKEGSKSSFLENQRQLTPGEQNFGKDQIDLGIADRSSATSPEARKRASRAFLDAEDSLSGLRASEAEMGIVHAAGRKFAKNPDAEGGEMEITKDQYRARMGGADMASAIKNNPAVDAAKGKATARKQQSAAAAQADASTGFNTDVDTTSLFGKGARMGGKMFGL